MLSTAAAVPPAAIARDKAVYHCSFAAPPAANNRKLVSPPSSLRDGWLTSKGHFLHQRLFVFRPSLTMSTLLAALHFHKSGLPHKSGLLLARRYLHQLFSMMTRISNPGNARTRGRTHMTGHTHLQTHTCALKHAHVHTGARGLLTDNLEETEMA